MCCLLGREFFLAFFFLAVELLPTAITWRNSPRDRSQRFDEGLGILGGGLWGDWDDKHTFLVILAGLPPLGPLPGRLDFYNFLEKKIGLHLAYCFFSQNTSRWRLGARKQNSKAVFAMMMIMNTYSCRCHCVLCAFFFWLRIRDREIKDRKEVVYPAPSLTRDGDAIC